MANLTLLDLAKRSNNDAQIGLVESAVQSNALLERLPFKEITGLSYKIKKRTGLPTAVTKAIGEGHASTKSIIKDYIYSSYFYADRSQVEVNLADNAPEGAETFRREEDLGHLAAMANLYNYHAYYGNNQTDQTEPDGIATILNSTALGANVQTQTGSSGSTTSIYFVSFTDANTPQGSMKATQGVLSNGKNINYTDAGIVYFQPDATNAPTKWERYYVTEFDAQLGFAVYDIRSIGRYMGLTSALAPTVANMDAIITGMLPFQCNAIFANKTGLNLLKGLKSTITYLPAEREIKLSPASYDGIPIFLDENIADTEV